MRNSKQGLILQIAIIVIALIALGFYFKVDMIGLVKKPELAKISQGLWNGLEVTWIYLKSGVAYVAGFFN